MPCSAMCTLHPQQEQVLVADGNTSPSTLTSTTSRPQRRLPSTVFGLLSSLSMAVLFAWRLGLATGEGLLGSFEILLFALSSWLLMRDSCSRGQGRQLITAVGMTLVTVRSANYVRVALLADQPPAEYVELFDNTVLMFAVVVLYVAESMFMQVLLKKLIPGWARVLLGSTQALLWARVIWRYTASSVSSPWHALWLTVLAQVGMFAPYHITKQYWVHKAISPTPTQTACSVTDQVSQAEESALDRITTDTADKQQMKLSDTAQCTAAVCQQQPYPPMEPVCVSERPIHQPSGCDCDTEARSAPTGLLPPGMVAGHSQQPNRASAKAHRQTAPKDVQLAAMQKGAVRNISAVKTAVRALSQAPYKSRLRTQNTVCVKLNTQVPYQQLPADTAQLLQRALSNSIGQATALHISQLVVRPGCICVCIKVEEILQPKLPHRSRGSLAKESAPIGPTEPPLEDVERLQVKGLADAVLPQLHRMLSTEDALTAIPSATVQLGDHRVACVWNEDRQVWDVQAPGSTKEHLATNLWLGVVTVTGMRSSAVRASGSVSPATHAVVQIVAEVQLWGVSKVSDVEGWTPPQQHQDSELKWPGAQQPSGSNPALKLLARAAGGYLPTQVVRLVPSSTDGYVTAQVLVQLHEHQLVRHHAGGSPSTLLLMDLELWQNEVLLSSSPLLSLPAAITSSHAPEPVAWWWGAADSTVAAALQELEQLAVACVLEASDNTHDAPAAIQAYKQYLEDASIWLAQVQRTALTQHICHCAPASRSDPSKYGYLQSPCLPPSVLQPLGEQLMQYAKDTGLCSVYRMVQQQLQHVVVPAAVVKHPRNPLSYNLRAVLFGYRCHHDEQLYKQRLAAHFSGMLAMSSAATAVIGFTWGARSLMSSVEDVQYPALILGNMVWSLLHALAMIIMLQARAKPDSPSKASSIKRAYWFIMLAYAWRVLAHVGMAVAALTAPMYLQTYQHAGTWVGMHVVLLFTEQVPASAVLPASWVASIGTLVEAPAVLYDVSRASGKHPLVAALAAYAVVVGVWLLVDSHLRRQLASTSWSWPMPRSHTKLE